jgi:predicted phage baseplate assembly protein
MPLPAPDLDDRTFQDLVDEAKRMVQRRCPEWTDHNVSDPGVTLIETFAYLTDQLLYRVNQVPDRLYLGFLDLIGVRLLPPTPARAPITFWLSAPATSPLTIGIGTEAGTVRTASVESIVFSTLRDLTIVPCTLGRIKALPSGAEDGEDDDDRTGVGHRGEHVDRTRRLADKAEFAAFRPRPRLGDTLLLGLSEPAPGCAVRLDFRGRVEGIGVNPDHPPLVWEAWTGGDWSACELESDTTGGLNTAGPIVLHLPDDHQASVIDGDRAGWIRARIVEPEPGQPPYTDSPIVQGLSACTVGGTVEAVNAEVVEAETLGEAEGVPGQEFPVRRKPILSGLHAPIVETSSEDGWEPWTEVDHFADSGAADRHFVLDAASGLVLFGPAVREPDGAMRQYGAVPAKGASVRIRQYAVGGGADGNVTERSISTLKSSIPFVRSVENRRPAQGGVDGETLEEAKSRGPLQLRTRGRAVTAQDYEVLAREAAPDVARVRCVPAGPDTADAGAVRVLVVPAAAVEDERILFENLVPPAGTLQRIAERLDEVRVVGTRVVVEPPRYRGITVVADLVAWPRVNRDRVREDALRVLYAHLNPLTGAGPQGSGWPVGRPVQAGEIFGLLQGVTGVELVADVRLYPADPVTGARGAQAARVEVEANSLVFSYEHQVRVESH